MLLYLQNGIQGTHTTVCFLFAATQHSKKPVSRCQGAGLTCLIQQSRLRGTRDAAMGKSVLFESSHNLQACHVCPGHFCTVSLDVASCVFSQKEGRRRSPQSRPGCNKVGRDSRKPVTGNARLCKLLARLHEKAQRCAPAQALATSGS